MQAIHTKYLGPTNTKGARIKATADGGTVTIPYPYELSGCDVHRKAAQALCEKLGWEWDHVTGVLPDGSRAHVMRPSSGLTQEHVNTLREYAHDTGPFRVSKLGATNLAAAARAAIKSACGED